MIKLGFIYHLCSVGSHLGKSTLTFCKASIWPLYVRDSNAILIFSTYFLLTLCSFSTETASSRLDIDSFVFSFSSFSRWVIFVLSCFNSVSALPTATFASASWSSRHFSSLPLLLPARTPYHGMYNISSIFSSACL